MFSRAVGPPLGVLEGMAPSRCIDNPPLTTENGYPSGRGRKRGRHNIVDAGTGGSNGVACVAAGPTGGGRMGASAGAAAVSVAGWYVNSLPSAAARGREGVSGRMVLPVVWDILYIPKPRGSIHETHHSQSMPSSWQYSSSKIALHVPDQLTFGRRQVGGDSVSLSRTSPVR